MRLFLWILFFPFLAFAQDFSLTENKTLKDQADYVSQIKFSPFGNYIAMSLGNNTTELYDKNWNKLFSTQGDVKAVASSCEFSPDERFLYFSKYRSQTDLAIFSFSENRVVQALQDHEEMIYTIAVSPDGKYLASGGADDFILVYSLEGPKPKLLKKFTFPEEKTYRLSFSTDSKMLLVGLNHGDIKVIELQHDAWLLTNTIEGKKYSVENISFSPTDGKVAISSSDFDIHIWQKQNGQLKKVQSILDLGANPDGLAYSPDGNYLAAGLSNGSIRVWKKTEVDTLKEVRRLYRHGGTIFDVSFSPDGKMLSSSSVDKSGIIWTIEGVQPSYKSLIGTLLGSDITLAQRKILIGDIPKQIVGSLDPKLLASKDEFETNMEFLKRREKLKSQLTSALQEKMEEFYHLEKKGQGLETKLDKVVSYDADRQVYFVLFMETPGKIKIPVNEAKSLKENWEKAKVLIQKGTDKNGENTYKKFTLIHPSGKSYEIDVTENPFIPGSNNPESSRSSLPAEAPTLAVADSSTNKRYGGTRYALLFATNDYDNYNDLINPLFDAKTIADELTRNYGYQTHLVENATLDEILRKLKRYAQLSYDKEDQLFIFFAGHGKYDDIFQEGYLVAKESKLQDEARTTFLSHSNLRTIVNNIPCEHIFLVMDVCFGGTFDPYLAAHRGDELYEEVAKTEYIERKMQHKTRLYLTSGGKEYVPDGRPGEHSPFARKMLEAFRSYGGKDGILTVGEITTYVEKVVPQPRAGEFGNNEPGSDFVFVAK